MQKKILSSTNSHSYLITTLDIQTFYIRQYPISCDVNGISQDIGYYKESGHPFCGSSLLEPLVLPPINADVARQIVQDVADP